MAACAGRPPASVVERDDPGSPLDLNAHLEFADQLLRTDDGDCEQRLSLAQSEIDLAAADASFSVVLPLGLAQLADLQYRIHVGRASCQAWAPQRTAELQQALASAQHSVDLYREVLDYQSMVVAQFNVAVTQRLLGNEGASLTALEAAIALDEEFGLRGDAADNTRLLAKWRGDPAGPGAAGASAEISPRTVTLKSWHPHDAQLNLQIDEACVIDGNTVRDHAERTFEQQVRRDLGSWAVSLAPGAIGYGGARWPEEISNVLELATSFERGLGIPAIRVSLKGDFERVDEVNSFSKDQLVGAHALLHDHMGPAGDPSNLGQSERHTLSVAFLPATVQTVAAEDYNLQVGMWSGATLEQGVWYKLATPLTLPGARQLLVANDLEFAYTRDVPCAGAATPRGCVEIVVHASPQPEDVKELMDGLVPQAVTRLSSRLHYWSATYIRIVTDPETLNARVYDVRRYWHLSDSKAVQWRVQNRSEHIVTSFTYP